MYIVLKNQDVRRKKIGYYAVLKAYLFFQKNVKDEVTTSISMIAEDLGSLSGNTRNSSAGIEKNIKEAISQLMEDEVIELVKTSSCSDWKEVSNKKLFRVKVNCKSKISNNFTQLTDEELEKLIQAAVDNNIELNKLTNVYLFIKSYIFNDNGICYKSIAQMQETLGHRYDTVVEALNVLASTHLIVITKINNKRIPGVYNLIDYVYSLYSADYNKVTETINKLTIDEN